MANDEDELNLISSILFQINHCTGKRMYTGVGKGDSVFLSSHSYVQFHTGFITEGRI